MKNFFTTLLLSGIIGSVASVLSDGSSLGKYVKYISALVCVVIVVNPLSGIIKGLTETFSQTPPYKIEESINESKPLSLEETAIKMTEDQISKKIEEKFGIIPASVSIVIDGDGKIEVNVNLNKEDEIYENKIKSFISELCR